MFPIVPFGTGFYNPWSPATFNGNPSSTGVAPFGDMDRSIKSMEKEMWDMKRGMDRAIRNVDRNVERDLFGRDFSSSLVHHASRPANMLEHYSLMNPIRYDNEGNRWLNCCFDMRSYKPEEISVTLNSKERSINVEASHEVKDKEHYVKRHYARKIYVPEDIKADLSKIELKSCLTNEGTLCVEAALPKATIEEARAATSKSLTNVGANVYPINVKTI